MGRGQRYRASTKMGLTHPCLRRTAAKVYDYQGLRFDGRHSPVNEALMPALVIVPSAER